MEEEEIVKQILYNLDNWQLEDETPSNAIDDLECNKKISEDEVLHFYNTAYNYALSYTNRQDFPVTTIIKTVENEEIEVEELLQPISTALYMWSAGLLWKKYNIRANDQIDETYPIGYGDNLIIQAKEILKNYKTYKFQAY